MSQPVLREQVVQDIPSRLLLDALLDAVIVNDEAGRILEVNQAAGKLFGYTHDELIGSSIVALAADPEDTLRLLRVSQPVSAGTRVKRKDGGILWAEITVNVVEWGGGKAFFATLRDATERRLAQDALRQSEGRYHTLTDQLQVGVLIQAPNAEIILSNAKALELLGLTEDQLHGKTSFDPSWNVIHEDGSAFPGPTHPVPQAIATRLPVRNVVMGVFRPKTQDRVWLLVNADPQLNADGSVHQVVCTFADITERKEAELYREAGRELLQIFNGPGSMKETVQRALAALRTRVGLDALGAKPSEVK